MVIVFESAHTRLPSIVSDVVPAAVPYKIVGTAAGESWTVAEGVGIGSTVSVSDPAAPVDVPTVYTVTADVEVSDWLEREFWGDVFTDTLIYSMDGRASFAVLFEGDAGGGWSPGLSFAQPLNRRRPAWNRPLVPGGPSWSFEGRVPLSELRTARAALDRGLVWVVHSHARCVEDCPLPRAMFAGVDGDVSEGAADAESRGFSFTLRELDFTTSGVPLVTWGEAAKFGVTWGDPTSFDWIRTAIAGA